MLAAGRDGGGKGSDLLWGSQVGNTVGVVRDRSGGRVENTLNHFAGSFRSLQWLMPAEWQRRRQ